MKWYENIVNVHLVMLSVIASLLYITLVGSMVWLWDENNDLKGQLELKTITLSWTAAERNVLEGLYIDDGDYQPISPEERVVLAEYESLLGLEDRKVNVAKIEEAIHWLTKDRYKNNRFSKERVRTLAEHFYEGAKAYGIPYEIPLAVAWGESRFRDDVCMGYKDSSAGAIGCMQVMPFWVEKLSFVDTVEELRFDVQANIMAGCAILRNYMDHPYTRMEHPIMAALRMYNYGEANYRRKKNEDSEFNGYAKRVIKKAVRIKRKVNI